MAAGDLTTVQAVAQYLPLPPGAANEPVIASLISAASAFIASYCGRRFQLTSYTESRNGTGGRILPLAQTPIASIAMLTIAGQTVPAGDPNTTPGYYFTPTMLMLNGYRFLRGFGNVAISYTAGYATIPLDLAQACIELVALRFRERPHLDLGSENINGQMTSFIHKAMQPSTQAVLDLYKKRTPLWP